MKDNCFIKFCCFLSTLPTLQYSCLQTGTEEPGGLYISWGGKASDMTERLTLSFHSQDIHGTHGYPGTSLSLFSVFLYLPVPLLLFLRPFWVLVSLHVFSSLGTPVSVGIWPYLDHHPAVSPPMGVTFPNMGSPESRPSAISCSVCESTTT